jgi:hypothetical protein
VQDNKPNWYSKLSSSPFQKEPQPTREQIVFMKKEYSTPAYRNRIKRKMLVPSLILAGVLIFFLFPYVHLPFQSSNIQISKETTQPPQATTDLSSQTPIAPQNNIKMVFTVFPSETEGWALYYEKDNQDKYQYKISHLPQGGTSWDTKELPISNQDHDPISDYVIPSFHTEGSSWILTTSGPALGSMSKVLFRTDDKGKSWIRLGNITNGLPGYVTGMTFRNQNEGWITAEYRGTEYDASHAPLYHSKDGGKTWSLQVIPVPKNYRFANAYPPLFDGTDKKHGILPVEMVDDVHHLVIYETNDGGQTWIKTNKKLDVFSTSQYFINFGDYTIKDDGTHGYSINGKSSQGYFSYVNGKGNGTRWISKGLSHTSDFGRSWSGQ